MNLNAGTASKQLYLFYNTVRVRCFVLTAATAATRDLKSLQRHPHLGEICSCGAFSHTPNKQSGANAATLGRPLSPTHQQFTCNLISPEFHHCISWGSWE